MSRRIACLAGLALALAFGAGKPEAQYARARPGVTTPPVARVILRPGSARLGEPVVYRVEISALPAAEVRWLAPDTGAAFTWGPVRRGESIYRPPSRRYGSQARPPAGGGGRLDTLWMEAPLQVFELGVVPIPGVRFEYRERPGDPALSLRAPTARLVVIPVLAAADSDATLRGVHGPLAAPWWERVPWLLVALIGLVLAALVSLFLWWRARRRAAVPAAPAAAALTPMEAALAALGELRKQALPEAGRLAEHAFLLGQILRRFLEATVPATRPGDTTPELLEHLRQAGLGAEDLRRLAGLLRSWDRVKFAREPMTVEEAHRTEASVEMFVRRAAPPAGAEAA